MRKRLKSGLQVRKSQGQYHLILCKRDDEKVKIYFKKIKKSFAFPLVFVILILSFLIKRNAECTSETNTGTPLPQLDYDRVQTMAEMSVDYASIFYNLGEKRALLGSVLLNGAAAVRAGITEKCGSAHPNFSKKTEPELGPELEAVNATPAPVFSQTATLVNPAEPVHERVADNAVCDADNAESAEVNAVQPIGSANGMELLEAIAALGLSVKRQGCWLWVFTTDAQCSTPLKALGFLWSHKRCAWYFTLKTESAATNPAVAEALKVIQGLGLQGEHRGDWVWVFGAQSSHETPLRAAGFQWSYKRGSWYFNPKQVKQSVPPKPPNTGTAWDYYSGCQRTAVTERIPIG